MALARTFEELQIYQKARELANGVYAATKEQPFAKDYGMVDQIRRASVSVLSNIAEGFERGSKTEFIQFLYIAKGSCGEVRAQLQIAHDQTYLEEKQSQRLSGLAAEISRMMSSFIGHLQAADFQGEKVERPKRLKTQKDKDRMTKLFAAHGITLPDYSKPRN